jgi:hypothetical protein
MRVMSNGYAWESHTATATFVGRGEFFSGIHTGDTVTVTRHTCYRPDGTVSSVSFSASKGGASLYVHREDIAVTGEWV